MALLYEGCQVAGSFIEYHMTSFDAVHSMNLKMDMDDSYRSLSFLEKYGTFNLVDQKYTEQEVAEFACIL